MKGNNFEFFLNTISLSILLAKASFGFLLISMFSYWFQAAFKYTKNIVLSKIPLLAMYAANITLAIMLLLRWIESGHFPLSNLYESLLFLSWSLTSIHLFLESLLNKPKPFPTQLHKPCIIKDGNESASPFDNGACEPITPITTITPEGGTGGTGLRSSTGVAENSAGEQIAPTLTLGAITSPLCLFTNAFATFSLPQEMQKVTVLVPALQSNWLIMHVSVMIISYAALLSGSLLAMAFLVSRFVEDKKISGNIPFSLLPTYLIPPALLSSKIQQVVYSSTGAGSKDQQTITTFSATQPNGACCTALPPTPVPPLPPLPPKGVQVVQGVMGSVVQQTKGGNAGKVIILKSRVVQQSKDGIVTPETIPITSYSCTTSQTEPITPIIPFGGTGGTEGTGLRSSIGLAVRTASQTEGGKEMVMLRDNEVRQHDTFQKNLPQTLDNLSYRSIGLGFALLTIGILSGAVWANEAWGSYWSWDPKETWAFVTWLVFAFYLHTRLSKGWVGKESAFVATFGFAVIWFCYLGVNLFGKGLHSYGWFHTIR